jgi:hypothetical protein
VIGQLVYLADEVCAGVEIYYSGRQGGQFYKTAFILCDDYTELVSKLFLLCDDAGWTDALAAPRFKSYHRVKTDLEDVIRQKRASDLRAVEALHRAMESRRERRNGFFHSAKLLDLSVTHRMCVESFTDLFDYATLLFGDPWRKAEAGARDLETYELLLRVEKLSLSAPTLERKLMSLLAEWPRNNKQSRSRGLQVAAHPEDLHLRLAVSNGGSEFRDRLRAMLPTPTLP